MAFNQNITPCNCQFHQAELAAFLVACSQLIAQFHELEVRLDKMNDTLAQNQLALERMLANAEQQDLRLNRILTIVERISHFHTRMMKAALLVAGVVVFKVVKYLWANT